MQELPKALAGPNKMCSQGLAWKTETTLVLIWRISYADNGVQRSQAEHCEVTQRLAIEKTKQTNKETYNTHTQTKHTGKGNKRCYLTQEPETQRKRVKHCLLRPTF